MLKPTNSPPTNKSTTLIKRFFIPITVITLLLLSYGIYFLFHDRLNGNETPLTNPQSPNIFIQNVSFDSHDAQGSRTFTINAKLATYYKSQDLMLFSQPDITSYSNLTHQPAWHLTAEQGRSNKNNSIITLSGNVQFHRIATTDSPAMTIHTSQATIQPKQSIASTDQPVTILQQHSIIHGTGLTANLKTGDYTLHSQTQGHYAPEPSP